MIAGPLRHAGRDAVSTGGGQRASQGPARPQQDEDEDSGHDTCGAGMHQPSDEPANSSDASSRLRRSGPAWVRRGRRRRVRRRPLAGIGRRLRDPGLRGHPDSVCEKGIVRGDATCRLRTVTGGGPELTQGCRHLFRRCEGLDACLTSLRDERCIGATDRPESPERVVDQWMDVLAPTRRGLGAEQPCLPFGYTLHHDDDDAAWPVTIDTTQQPPGTSRSSTRAGSARCAPAPTADPCRPSVRTCSFPRVSGRLSSATEQRFRSPPPGRTPRSRRRSGCRRWAFRAPRTGGSPR